MAIELLSPAVILASAILLVVLERLFPYDAGQKILREGFWTDLIWYTLLQSYLLALVISSLIRWVDVHVPISRYALVSHWTFPAQVLFFLLLHDLYIYFFHRWQHHSILLWRIHEAHHSVREVDWLAGSRSHALEIMINQTVEFLPMTLLGAAPELPIVKGMIDAVWGMYIHSNLNVRTGVLQFVVNGPEMHRWHHAREITSGGINFGTKLAIWDWIFGTARLPNVKPTGYGLGKTPFPRGYWAQQVHAFRSLHTSPVSE
jgi:sterol desaturase/sphingolipid hydroxylase (fatty acid hydroxylase superfamily)